MHRAHDQIGRTTLIQSQKAFLDLFSETAHLTQRLLEIGDHHAQLRLRPMQLGRRPSLGELC